MKRSTAFGLILGVLFICGLVAYATASQAGGNNSAEAWLAAQRQTPALWALDAAALYTLLLSASYGGQSTRLRSRNAQIDRLHDEHRAQLEAMLANTDKAEETHAAQADQITTQEEKITAQEETIRSLSEQAAALQQKNIEMQAEIDLRQEAFEIEARRLTEQAFRALSGQVDANARQLDAVNLALQYHRAEIQQLRHGLRAVQPGAEPTRVARLTPAELAAITTQDIDISEPDLNMPDTDASDPEIVADDSPVPASEAPQEAASPSGIETPDFSAPDTQLPNTETPELPTSNSQHPEPPNHFGAPDTQHPYSDNAPATVIMDPIYFRVVPAEEDVPGAPTGDAPTPEQDTEIGPKHETVPALPYSSDFVTQDEYHALISPLSTEKLSTDEGAANGDNAHTSPQQSEIRLAHWQRRL